MAFTALFEKGLHPRDFTPILDFTRNGKEDYFHCSLRGMHSLNEMKGAKIVQLELNIVFLKLVSLGELPFRIVLTECTCTRTQSSISASDSWWFLFKQWL